MLKKKDYAPAEKPLTGAHEADHVRINAIHAVVLTAGSHQQAESASLPNSARMERFLRRALDVTVSLAVLTLCMPLLLLIGVIIRLDCADCESE